MVEWIIKGLRFFLVMGWVGLLSTSCNTLKAPRMKNGDQVVMSLYLDGGKNGDMNEKQKEQREQVLEYLSADLMERLQNAGYLVKRKNKPNSFKASPKDYLLDVKVVEYNPGSVAGRMFVGYGVGGASLNLKYKLLGSGSKPLIESDDGAFSGRDWRRIVEKVNQNIVVNVTEKLNRHLKTGH